MKGDARVTMDMLAMELGADPSAGQYDEHDHKVLRRTPACLTAMPWAQLATLTMFVVSLSCWWVPQWPGVLALAWRAMLAHNLALPCCVAHAAPAPACPGRTAVANACRVAAQRRCVYAFRVEKLTMQFLSSPVVTNQSTAPPSTVRSYVEVGRRLCGGARSLCGVARARTRMPSWEGVAALLLRLRGSWQGRPRPAR